MDWRLYCVIDNKDGRDITEDILSIYKNEESYRYCITFVNSPIEFKYSLGRITYIEEPKQLAVDNRLVFIKGKLQPEIKEILHFDSWCKVIYFDDKKATVPFSSIQFVKDKRTEQGISAIVDYLMEVAAIDESRTSDEDDEPGFLVSQLKDMKIRDDSVLNTLLNQDNLSKEKYNNPIIAPFSANLSQMQAIKRALQSKISIIQGPPGTGKTQTILNIISNLLIEGKTIAVVSGNNEATRNVYEKLERENLGSLCAFLGNKANIEHFFSSQPSKDTLKKTFEHIDKASKPEEMKEIEEKVKEIYKSTRKKANYISFIRELQVEETENEYNTSPAPRIPKKLLKDYSSEGLLKSAAFIETIYSSFRWMFLTKFKMFLHFGFWPKSDFSPSTAIDFLLGRYYPAKIDELKSAIQDIAMKYPSEYINDTLKTYYGKSTEYLFYYLKERYSKLEDKCFTPKGYRTSNDFLTHYPIVLSTTHSLQYSAPRGVLFDYVIIDESSQVNLTSAFLALASARNAVIVGDSKQLPHVVPEILKEPLDVIRHKYNLPSFIDYRRFSILGAIIAAYGGNIPNTLLKEHYRCDPEIIGFCNKRFYDNQLVIQTQHKKSCGIKIIETPSHTAIGRTNPRQMEIIRSEILPSQEKQEDIGVVAPYRDQVSLIRNNLKDERILVDTVHKFQGKERDTIILSTTSDRTVFYNDPEQTDFLNNPNLINVAVSRAKKKLFVIASSEALNQKGTLLHDFSSYAQYYSSNTERRKTDVLSVFDLMYDDYSPILEEMKKRMLKISEYDSENIIGTVINDICVSRQFGLLSFKFNYPLRKIISPDSVRDIEDRNFILSPGSHCDFVIFDDLSKKIQLIVEVDGKQHEKTIQNQRDKRKDRILKSFGLNIIRIKTTDVNIKETIEKQLC
ncbi:MAG: AAA domain-containing protein [Candidatus Ornithospirochaeta sp.]